MLQQQLIYYIDIFKLFCFLMVMGHLFASIFLSLGHYEERGWLHQKNLENETWQTQYLRAFYFAIVTMGTVGYGDVTAVTNLE